MSEYIYDPPDPKDKLCRECGKPLSTDMQKRLIGDSSEPWTFGYVGCTNPDCRFYGLWINIPVATLLD